MLTIGAFLLGAVLTTQSNVQVTTTAVVHYATAYADEAWQNVDDTFDTQGPDGRWHHGCTIEIDEPSSHIICADGFHEES